MAFWDNVKICPLDIEDFPKIMRDFRVKSQRAPFSMKIYFQFQNTFHTKQQKYLSF